MTTLSPSQPSPADAHDQRRSPWPNPQLGSLLLALSVATPVIWLWLLAWQADPPRGTSHWAFVLVLVLQRLRIVGVTVAWVLAVLGVGCEVGRFVLPPLEAGRRWLFRAALGMGVTAVLVLALGALAAGWAVGVVWVLGLAALVRRTWAERHELAQAMRSRLSLSGWEWLWVLVSVGALLLALVCLFLPPLDYDVLEYHLGVPARYLEAGRIAGLPTNVYSNFPLTAEMHYLVGLAALGKVEGGCFAKLFNLFCSALAALGVAALARELFRSRKAATLALAVFASSGWLLVLACAKAYVEPALTALVVLAVLAFLCWSERRPGPEKRRWLLLSALLVGFACGTKYPAALFLGAPLAGWLLVAAARRKEGRKGALVGVTLFVAVAMLAFAPWLVKNVMTTGNPIFPLLQGVFGGGGWSDADLARWTQAHPLGITQLGRLAVDLQGLLTRPGELPPLIFSPAAFVFLPLVLFLRGRRRRALLLVGYVGLCVALWLLFTHRIQRFLVPALAVSIALSAGGVEALSGGRLRELLRGVAALLLLVSLVVTWPFIPGPVLWAQDLERPRTFLETYCGVYPAYTFAEGLSSDERMLSVGEARSFYFGPDVRMETVFDPKLLDRLLADGPAPMELARRLRERGFAYVFVNWWELARLQSTYAYDYGGRGRAGYSEQIDSALFERLEEAGAISLRRAFGPSFYTLETRQGWRYSPLLEDLLKGPAVPDEGAVRRHPHLYVIYHIGGTGEQ